MCKFKSFLDVVFTNNIQPPGMTKLSVFIKSLINNIPAVDFPFIPGYYRQYMIVHSFQKAIPADRVAGFIFKNPFRNLRMPDEAMTNNKHIISHTKSNKTIGFFKTIFI